MRPVVSRLLWVIAAVSAAVAVCPVASRGSVARASEPGEPPGAQVSGPAFEWTARPVSLSSGQDGELLVELVIPAGVAVHAYDVQLVVVDADGLTVGAPVLPDVAPKATSDDGLDARLTGRVPIRLALSTRGAEAGLHAIRLAGEVQGCAARRCLGATRTEIEVLVNLSEPRG